MPTPQLVERPQRQPGVCAISGTSKGPMIDTGRDYQDSRGRIYVSVQAQTEFLRELDWLGPDEVKPLRERAEKAEAELAEARERLSALEDLEAAAQKLVEPRIEEKVVTQEVTRAPTDEEIDRFIKANPSHPALSPYYQPPAGSYEEWTALYGTKGPRTREQQAADEAEERRKVERAQRAIAADGTVILEDPEEKGEHDENSPPSTVTLNGTDVDLDELLGNPVKDIVAYCEGHPVEFQRAVVAREAWLRSAEGKQPRKTLVDGLDTEPVDDDADTEE